MSHAIGGLACAAGLMMMLAACASSGAGGREVSITQTDSGCTPAAVQATPGEKLKLVVKNESGKDYEIEGIEGTKLEEVVVPAGKTRTPGYTVPGNPGTHKIKCYVPGGVSTIIEVQAGGDARTVPAAAGSESAAAKDGTPVQVSLADYTVTPDAQTVTPGTITFTVANTTTDHVHELAVLRTKDDGSFENLAEVEDIDPQGSGSVTLDLPAGDYVLACLMSRVRQGARSTTSSRACTRSSRSQSRRGGRRLAVVTQLEGAQPWAAGATSGAAAGTWQAALLPGRA